VKQQQEVSKMQTQQRKSNLSGYGPAPITFVSNGAQCNQLYSYCFIYRKITYLKRAKTPVQIS
jgi:hypothetical protein